MRCCEIDVGDEMSPFVQFPILIFFFVLVGCGTRNWAPNGSENDRIVKSEEMAEAEGDRWKEGRTHCTTLHCCRKYPIYLSTWEIQLEFVVENKLTDELTAL